MVLCKTCNGRGQTKKTSTVMKDAWAKQGKPQTIKLGYGCLDCLGRGIHGPRREYGKEVQGLAR